MTLLTTYHFVVNWNSVGLFVFGVLLGWLSMLALLWPEHR